MQVVAAKANQTCDKCPECRGAGVLVKLWPLYAISMPHELGWQRFTCWRCKGTGNLPEDDPYVGNRLPRPRDFVPPVVLIWFWLYMSATFIVIYSLVWL